MLMAVLHVVYLVVYFGASISDSKLQVLQQLSQGASIAIISDAGTPKP